MAAHQLGFDDLGTPLFATTFVVLDLETTGLRPTTDRITEIGAVKVRGGELLGELRTFVHPGCPIPPVVTAITGISDAMVRDAPMLHQVLPSLLRFLTGAVLVAHNARFDVSFLRAAVAACDGDRFDPEVLDTARLSRRLLADEVRDHRLATLAHHLRARARPDHRALTDARATVDVLHALLERAGSYGATTVEDLRELTRSRSDRLYRRRELVRDAPSACGVYRFVDERDEVLYIGKATDLRARLRTYFGQDPRRRIADMVRETARVEWEPTSTLVEAEVRELRLLAEHRPRFNRRSTRPEPAVHLAITREAFPRLSVTRHPGPRHRRCVGPLRSRRAAEHLQEALTTALPVRSCTARLRRAQDHPACILKDLGRCGAPCDGTQGPAAYEQVIARLEACLDDPSPLLASLRAQMSDASAAGRYERARSVRSLLHGTARALAEVRARQALAAAGEVIAARVEPDGCEVAVLHESRLITTLRFGAGTRETTMLDTARGRAQEVERPDGPAGAEELGVVLRWLKAPSVRLLAVQHPLADRVAGGRALADEVADAARVARQVRRDQQLLEGGKVVRRSVEAARA